MARRGADPPGVLPRRRGPHDRRRGPREVREPQRLLAGRDRRGLRLAARGRRRRGAAARASSTGSSRSPSASTCKLAQPAHRLSSHAAWPVTRRRPASVARETAFVEIGPVTAFHRDTFAALLPFPDLKMGWGLDAYWSARRARARVADRRRRRDAGAPRRPRGRGVRARGGGRRGARVPRRPAVRDARRGLPDAADVPMRVAVVAEFYPRAEDPVLGVWAHRQALAARDAGADVRVFVLHRLVPPRADFTPRSLARKLRQPRRTTLDGIEVEYVPFVSPPRGASYGSWGRWAARPLARALRRHDFDLVHAHNAVPAGDAVLRARGRARTPLVVSVHGGDVFFTARRGRSRCARTFAAARMVLANSAGVAEMVEARDVRVVHLGTDVPEEVVAGSGVVTVAHLDPRKRHADVIRALPRGRPLRDRRRRARARGARGAGRRARRPSTASSRTTRALEVARRCGVFAMPSTDEAFGVAYVEAMAGGLPAIGCAGEPGPEEIARAGEGMRLVPPGDVDALRAAIAECLAAPNLGAKARRPSCASSPGSAAAPRRSPPTRTALRVKPLAPRPRGDPAGPRRVVPRAARARAAARRALRRASGCTRRAASTTRACPSSTSTERERRAAGRAGRGRSIAGTSGRVALPAAYAGARRARRAVRPVDRAVGAPAHPRAPRRACRSCATSTATPTPSRPTAST